tara:strand:+ start:1000 stop:1383 length:384 start_codon:yes stop_codon:yes gene_type:complete
MVISTTAAFATNASASAARNYTTNRDPIDIGIADFNCDGFNDMAIATDGTHTISVLTNDGTGDFSDRYDIWVSKNTSETLSGTNSRMYNSSKLENSLEIPPQISQSSNETIRSRQTTTALLPESLGI